MDENVFMMLVVRVQFFVQPTAAVLALTRWLSTFSSTGKTLHGQCYCTIQKSLSLPQGLERSLSFVLPKMAGGTLARQDNRNFYLTQEVGSHFVNHCNFHPM